MLIGISITKSIYKVFLSRQSDERVGIIVDASSNVRNSSNFELIKNSILQFTSLHTSPKRHKLGMISYGAKPELDLSFQKSQNDESIKKSIKNMKYVLFCYLWLR